MKAVPIQTKYMVIGLIEKTIGIARVHLQVTRAYGGLSRRAEERRKKEAIGMNIMPEEFDGKGTGKERE